MMMMLLMILLRKYYDDDNAQEIMMLLIGESSMSHAHLVNGAVVNVRARVRLIFIFFSMMIGFDQGSL